MSFFLSFFFFLLGGRERYFFKWGWHLNWDYKISHLHMRCRKTSTHRKFVQVMEIEISRFFVSFCFVLFSANGWVQFSSVQSLSRVRLIATPWIVARQSSLLLLLLLSRLSRVRLCMTPETAANQASPSLGFSWQEHWSGLPFPSPMHESEKWSRSVMSNSSDPMDCSPPGSSVHGIFQARILERVAISFSRESSRSGIEPSSPALQADLPPLSHQNPNGMGIQLWPPPNSLFCLVGVQAPRRLQGWGKRCRVPLAETQGVKED